MLAGNYTLSALLLCQNVSLNCSVWSGVWAMSLIHMWYPGTVLPFSRTNLAQFGLVIWNMFLFGDHDDPASKALLAKCLCAHQGSHTYKRCSSQPSYTSLWSRRKKASPPQRRE